MSLYYDFHIHTALSPCGDDDMTPNNIINMAALKGLDAIAITDHNCALNVRACCECGKAAGLIVVPGMEVETSEEVHVVCLFDDVDKAEKFGEYVSGHIPPIKNRIDIFGEQYVLNSDDEIIKTVDNLLSTATTIDIYSLVSAVKEYGGIAIPAHVDKSSYSIISNLGFIPEDLLFSTLEVKMPEKILDVQKVVNTEGYHIIHDSDAHFLWDISERIYHLDTCADSAGEIIDYLKRKPI